MKAHEKQFPISSYIGQKFPVALGGRPQGPPMRLSFQIWPLRGVIPWPII